VATETPEQSEVLVTREGAVVTLTFNRPEARNALTWNMYERLYEACEEVDADDSVRVFVLRGAGGKAFVAGTDIGQFKSFKTAEDGIRYERDGERRHAEIAAREQAAEHRARRVEAELEAHEPDDARRVRGFEPLANLHSQIHDFSWRHRCALEAIGERLSLQELERDVGDALLGGAGVEDVDDVCALDRAGGLRLAPQRTVHLGGEARQRPEQHVAVDAVQHALTLPLADHQARALQHGEMARHRRRAEREAVGELGGIVPPERVVALEEPAHGVPPHEVDPDLGLSLREAGHAATEAAASRATAPISSITASVWARPGNMTS